MKRGARIAWLLVALAATACREIPPEIPEGYIGGPTTPGWPPRAVYHPEPFHPANRLHQRVFVLERDGDFDEVDRAEIETLTERAAASELDPESRARFEAEMREEAARLEASEQAGERAVGAVLRGMVR